MGNRLLAGCRNQELIFRVPCLWLQSSGNVLGYKVTGTITADDIKKMEPEVNALVQKEGNIRILFNLGGPCPHV